MVCQCPFQKGDRHYFAEGYHIIQTVSSTDCYLCLAGYCNVTWDEMLCWSETPAGSRATQDCPSYVKNIYEGMYLCR